MRVATRKGGLKRSISITEKGYTWLDTEISLLQGVDGEGWGHKHCGVALRESREHLALAAAVRELRARERLSQEELSLAAGLHRGYVWELESGRRRVSFASVAALAEALRMPLSELIDRYEAALARLEHRG